MPVINPPELPALRARGFQLKLPLVEGEPTYEHLGQATFVVTAIAMMLVKEPRAPEPLELSELGQASLFATKLEDMIMAREVRQDRLPDAFKALLDSRFGQLQTTVETRLTSLQEILEKTQDELTATKGELTAMKNELQYFRTTFAQVPRAALLSRILKPHKNQKFNRECPPGANFQPVPYADGEFPDAAEQESGEEMEEEENEEEEIGFTTDEVPRIMLQFPLM
ncbi:hypothetical protein FRC01_002848 [Tulasnella sp. 417]|nr:hypothetical protein FRC01_002848 [Tulasnella sp. 417]